MYLSYEQVDAATVKTVSALTIPAEATHAELQASGGDISYTMDGETDNPGSGRGMIMHSDADPKLFLIEDVRNIRFVRGNGVADANLNIHYVGGRSIA